MEYLLISLTLVFTTAGQLLQKVAADKANLTSGYSLIHSFAVQKETWYAILFLSTGMAFWLAVLYMVEVSTAYPFLSIGFILVLLASHFILKEKITLTRIAGCVVIVVGVVLVSAS
ncbi:MAG: 4-amino-4-deoxy-L-arabinose-phospho-UDP flippase [Gammaproteobacteria bacterium]|nr:MAG: 4-amino-4-deoxy-L-arabinose-phospho-UDP flippase [Gammaproteobacteria bacterium]